MGHTNIDDSFPSIPTSFHHQPHGPIFSFNQPLPSLEKPAADVHSPQPKSTLLVYPSNPTTDAPLRWTSPVMSRQTQYYHSSHSSSHTMAFTSSIAGSASQGKDMPKTARSSLSKGAKIGIFAGLAVVIILAVVACGMGVLDCRKRHKRRQERKQNRGSELTMLESEIRTGRTGQKRETDIGLWDHLKVEAEPTESTNAEDGLQRERFREAGSRENCGETRKSGKQEKVIETAKSETEVEWLPAYMPRERVSVVSSVGSLPLSATGKPVMPRGLLEGESRR